MSTLKQYRTSSLSLWVSLLTKALWIWFRTVNKCISGLQVWNREEGKILNKQIRPALNLSKSTWDLEKHLQSKNTIFPQQTKADGFLFQLVLLADTPRRCSHGLKMLLKKRILSNRWKMKSLWWGKWNSGMGSVLKELHLGLSIDLTRFSTLSLKELSKTNSTLSRKSTVKIFSDWVRELLLTNCKSNHTNGSPSQLDCSTQPKTPIPMDSIT